MDISKLLTDIRQAFAAELATRARWTPKAVLTEFDRIMAQEVAKEAQAQENNRGTSRIAGD
jgi:hypothetical protein